MKRIATVAALLATTSLAWGATAAVASASPRPVNHGIHMTAQPGGPVVRAGGHSSLPTISLNWSGYAATANRPFNTIHSTWVQPAIKCTGVANQWTSNWVGLDGFTDGTVEQDGTFANCAGKTHMTPNYIAWYEMYPAGSVGVFHVSPGDVMYAAVNYTGGQFALTITDQTTGRSVTKSAGCSVCERTSAEVVVERPALCNSSFTRCFLTELAHFMPTTMGGAQAEVDGGTLRDLAAFHNNPIYMVDLLKTGFISLDEAGPLAGQQFEVVWDRSGTITPITLGPRQ